MVGVSEPIFLNSVFIDAPQGGAQITTARLDGPLRTAEAAEPAPGRESKYPEPKAPSVGSRAMASTLRADMHPEFRLCRFLLPETGSFLISSHSQLRGLAMAVRVH